MLVTIVLLFDFYKRSCEIVVLISVAFQLAAAFLDSFLSLVPVQTGFLVVLLGLFAASCGSCGGPIATS